MKYHWNAQGRHGLHSPFVYELVDRCFQVPVEKHFLKERYSFYHKLKANKNEIITNDFGVGSHKMKHKRTVSELFKYNSSKGKYANLLYQISNYYRPKKMLEFGTSLGVGSIHLSKGNQEAHITTIDACTETQRQAIKHFQQLDCQNIDCINSTFTHFLRNKISDTFDLIYIDGHHDGSALVQYLYDLDSHIHNETIILLDDIRWSDSMYDAWKKIISDTKFHLTIDLFRMGMIFKRSQQAKQHFVLRY